MKGLGGEGGNSPHLPVVNEQCGGINMTDATTSFSGSWRENCLTLSALRICFFLLLKSGKARCRGLKLTMLVSCKVTS